jgi:hypothetical protein
MVKAIPDQWCKSYHERHKKSGELQKTDHYNPKSGGYVPNVFSAFSLRFASENLYI